MSNRPHQIEANDEQSTNKGLLSRRKALGALGVGAAVASAPSLAAAASRRRGGSDGGRVGRRSRPNEDTASATLPGEATSPPGDVDRFSRLFDDHPPFIEPSDDLRAMLAELGCTRRPARRQGSARSRTSSHRRCRRFASG